MIHDQVVCSIKSSADVAVFLTPVEPSSGRVADGGEFVGVVVRSRPRLVAVVGRGACRLYRGGDADGPAFAAISHDRAVRCDRSRPDGQHIRNRQPARSNPSSPTSDAAGHTATGARRMGARRVFKSLAMVRRYRLHPRRVLREFGAASRAARHRLGHGRLYRVLYQRCDALPAVAPFGHSTGGRGRNLCWLSQSILRFGR